MNHCHNNILILKKFKYIVKNYIKHWSNNKTYKFILYLKYNYINKFISLFSLKEHFNY